MDVCSLQLCVRGLVHVFKFLDTMAMKEEKSRTDGNATLRRNAAAKQNAVVSEIQKIRRQHVDSGYSTSDGVDKRWSQELPQNGNTTENGNSKWSPRPLHIRTTVNGRKSPTGTATSISTYQPQTKSDSSTPALSPAGNNNLPTNNSNNGDEFKRPLPVDTSTPKRYANSSNGGSNSNRLVLRHFFLVYFRCVSELPDQIIIISYVIIYRYILFFVCFFFMGLKQ